MGTGINSCRRTPLTWQAPDVLFSGGPPARVKTPAGEVRSVCNIHNRSERNGAEFFNFPREPLKRGNFPKKREFLKCSFPGCSPSETVPSTRTALPPRTGRNEPNSSRPVLPSEKRFVTVPETNLRTGKFSKFSIALVIFGGSAAAAAVPFKSP